MAISFLSLGVLPRFTLPEEWPATRHALPWQGSRNSRVCCVRRAWDMCARSNKHPAEEGTGLAEKGQQNLARVRDRNKSPPGLQGLGPQLGALLSPFFGERASPCYRQPKKQKR